MIMDEARPREHLVGNVDTLDGVPGDGALGGTLRRRARRGIMVERDVTGELPIAGPDIARTGDCPVIDIQQRGIDTETFRCSSEETLAHFGAGVAERAAGLLDRQAPRGDTLV